MSFRLWTENHVRSGGTGTEKPQKNPRDDGPGAFWPAKIAADGGGGGGGRPCRAPRPGAVRSRDARVTLVRAFQFGHVATGVGGVTRIRRPCSRSNRTIITIIIVITVIVVVTVVIINILIVVSSAAVFSRVVRVMDYGRVRSRAGAACASCAPAVRE